MSTNGPALTVEEREELACLDFYLAELDRLRDRGLIASLAHATVAAETRARRESIVRRGRPADEPVPFPIVEARAALQRGDDAKVVSLCTARLADEPDHFDATVMLAFVRQRQGQLDDALTLYRRLTEYQPDKPTWGQWVRTIEQRIAARPEPTIEPAVTLERAPTPAAVVAPVDFTRLARAARPSWASVTGEFLKEHRQNLILCLGVLLIVVSSNVGAYQLLGPRLWSPVGKCVLALVYTAMFAGLGVALVRWGAERAGRIMLLTTLIVVPADFMLAGQLKLLTEPSAYRFALLGVDAAALFALVRVVATSLRLARAAGFLSVALFVLSAFNAAASPGSPWPWAWQFAVFLVPAAVFLGSVARVTVPEARPEQDEGRAESIYFALGLLAFAFLSGVLRTGIFALELPPTLYALPVMTAALACVLVAARLGRFDKDPRHKAWVRFAGLGLSGLAFALAVAKPPVPSSLFSGNTLATAVLGLGMYAALLRTERKPMYLYIGFGALVVSYFGAFYFAKDLMHAVEEAARRGMGYEKKLPEPFRAINGLVFSPLLAALSIYFRRAWRDDRLARHCHYLGVPFSVAACVFSGFEPKAALICLSGYAVLYAVAVRVFSAPWVTYLAAAALAGAVYFGLTLRPGSTLAIQALVGAALGFGYWLIAAGFRVRGTDEAYRKPLLHAALFQVGLAALLCGMHTGQLAGQLGRPDFLTMAAALGLAAVTLTLLTRTYPVVALAHLTIACGLGAWLCLVQAAHGGVLDGFAAYAAAGAAYAVGLIAAEEAARAFAGKKKTADPDFGSTATPGIDLFAAALPGFEVVLVLATVALAVAGFRNGPEVIFTFAAGAVATLWATRHRRSEGLVDLGLSLAVAACVCLTAWRVGWRDFGVGLAWSALTMAGCSFALRVIARGCANRGALGLYVVPCHRAAAWLTWPVLALAVVGRMGSDRAFPVSVAALGLNALVLVLLAGDRRRSAFTYRAVVSAVFAAYVVVFSVGQATPDSGYVLGLVAVTIALALSAVGLIVRWRAGVSEWPERVFAGPLFRAAIVLTVLAVAPAHRSPWTMLAVGVSFLVMVKGVPARGWIYATVASWACGVYFGVLGGVPGERLITAAMVGAYQLWLVGLLVRQVEPALIRWLRLPQRGYDYPLFNSAAISCLVAVALRLDLTWVGPEPWSDSAGLALNVAGFLMLMIKPYPHTAWAHAAIVVASLGVGLAAYPTIPADAWWLALGMGLANAWAAVAGVFRRYASPVCRRLGIAEAGYSEAVALWSRAFFVLSAGAVAAVVVLGVLAALAGVTEAKPTRDGAWAGLMAAVALGGVYVVATWWRRERAEALMALGGLAVLAVWWLAAPVSPLVTRYGLKAAMFLPLSTAALAAATVAAGLALANRPGWRGGFWRKETDADPRARLDAFSLQAGLGLAIVAALMTRAGVNLTTVAALALATAALGLPAAVRRWVAAGYAGALMWCATALFAVLVAARRLGVTGDADRAVVVAAAMLAASALLWLAAGFLRRGAGKTGPGEAARLPAGSVAIALEQVLLTAGFVAAGLVGGSALGAHAPGRVEAATAVGVLFGLALLAIGLIVRWGEEALVYAAQGALVGCYLYYRRAFPVPGTADVAVLSLLGYLDLGLAEMMRRAGLHRLARPSRYCSLALPVLPLVLGLFEEGGLGGSRLYFLFTAATFYAIAGQSMRWRPLWYASAVLYNAALWLLWGRFGWALADRPQYYLVPVGLSAVLFAGAERRALGRAAANAIRGVGLAVIYLSLAFPVWQFASFGAWLTLLLVSLAGVFVGIGLRAQVFLWFGLVGFTLDVVYQLGKMGLEHTLAKWAIMLALGLLLILFAALNEKKKLVPTVRLYLDQARQWD